MEGSPAQELEPSGASASAGRQPPAGVGRIPGMRELVEEGGRGGRWELVVRLSEFLFLLLSYPSLTLAHCAKGEDPCWKRGETNPLYKTRPITRIYQKTCSRRLLEAPFKIAPSQKLFRYLSNRMYKHMVL